MVQRSLKVRANYNRVQVCRRMAEPVDDTVEEGQVLKKKYLNEQTQGLEKVTDYVEEQEISGLQNVQW